MMKPMILELKPQAVIKRLIDDIHFYSKESFIDFACSHFREHYSCYVDVEIRYYHINNNVYVAINPVFIKNNREFLEILLIEKDNNYLSADILQIEDSFSGSYICFVEGDPDDVATIYYENFGTKEMRYYDVRHLEGRVELREIEE